MAYRWYDFSFKGFFQSIDSSFIFWALAFLVLLFVLNYVFTKFFKKQKGVGTVIAIIVSLLTIYWSSKRFDIDYIFTSSGIDVSFLPEVLPFALILVLLIMLWKLRLGKTLILLGILAICAGIFEWVYQTGFSIVLGIILILLGLWILRRKKKGKKDPPLDDRRRKKKEKKEKEEKEEKKKEEKEKTDRTRKAMGEASLDVIAGGKHLKRSGNATLDLMANDSTVIYVKNGGTGGKLGWRASSHGELSISPSSGRLAIGRTQAIKVKVKKRTGRSHPGVMINGRGGGRLGGRPTRGRVLIYFKVK